MKKLEFTIQLDAVEGMEAASITPPFDIMETFGTKGRVPVCGTINGYPFRSSLMPMGGCHFMVVNKQLREGAKVKAGDTVKIVMARDTAERTVEVPSTLQKHLDRSKAARESWAKRSFTHQKEMARWVTEPKREETRAKRLAEVVDILTTGKRWPH